MLWLVLGLGAAVGDAGADGVTKRFFSHLSPYGMGLVRLLYALPPLVLLGCLISWPPLDRTFWLLVAIMLPLDITAMLFYMKALKVCHLSLCIPFLAFTPVFLIFTGWAVLGEELNRWGIVGTCFIGVGSYVLSLGAGQTGVLAPLKALVREKGALLMLAVAAIYSLTGALYKVALFHSTPNFLAVVYPLAFAIIVLAGYPLSGVRLASVLAPPRLSGIFAGFFMILSVLCVAHALVRAPVAYLIAVKRLSLLISVLMGGLWLKERLILPRVLGAVLMCAGVALIAGKGF